MKEITEQAKQGNLSQDEIKEINCRLNNLVAQVNAIDSESRGIEGREIIE